MNFKTTTISALCLFSLAFVIACGAQNDSLNTDEFLIKEIMNDPLTEQFNANNQKQTDLILYNSLDMPALRNVLINTPDSSSCNVTGDLSHIAHAREYFDNMCQHVQLMNAITKKYPEVKNLEPDVRLKLFYHTEPLTDEEVRNLYDSRKKID